MEKGLIYFSTYAYVYLLIVATEVIKLENLIKIFTMSTFFLSHVHFYTFSLSLSLSLFLSLSLILVSVTRMTVTFIVS